MSENSEDCEYETIYFDILEFLATYEKLPCLWDRYHKRFKDRKERLKCEEILGEKLGIHDMRTLRRKIRSVRGTYNTEIRKLKYCIEKGDEVNAPKLFWFPTADKFLRVTTDLPYNVFPLCEEQCQDQNIIQRKRLLEKLPRKKGVKLLMITTPMKQAKIDQDPVEYCIKEEIDQENNYEQNIDNYEEYEELEEEDDKELETIEEDKELETLEEDEEEQSQDGDRSMQFEMDKFEQSEYNESASSKSKFKRTSNSQNLKDVVNYIKDSDMDNEFIVFGRSIGMQLKNMPLNIAVRLQLEIQSHITKTRLKYLKQTRKEIESE